MRLDNALRSIPAWAGETPPTLASTDDQPVYPRVGGGNRRSSRPKRRLGGLSPRGRGKHFLAANADAARRSIPAWAGETCWRAIRLFGCAVYPRVGGGNHKPICGGNKACGLSPRGRGKQFAEIRPDIIWGSIPAWAGETSNNLNPNPKWRVYPRVGGGNFPGPCPKAGPVGLSPRGRGKPAQANARDAMDGSIPAWAGETHIADGGGREGKVYPRVGGGNENRMSSSASRMGLSPRGRGKPVEILIVPCDHRSIPAWAGETTMPPSLTPMRPVYPRVGGGNSSGVSARPHIDGLSPRGRGKLVLALQHREALRSIPAWAGETYRGRVQQFEWAVYPRVGGGNLPIPRCAKSADGLSPRGRGKRRG